MYGARAITASLAPQLYLNRWPPCHGRLRCDLQEFTVADFTEPLRFALVALGVGIVLGLLWRGRLRGRRHGSAPTPIPLAGLLFAAAALAGYQRTGHLVVGLAVSAALLAGGGLIADLGRLPLAPRMLLATAWGCRARRAICPAGSGMGKGACRRRHCCRCWARG